MEFTTSISKNPTHIAKAIQLIDSQLALQSRKVKSAKIEMQQCAPGFVEFILKIQARFDVKQPEHTYRPDAIHLDKKTAKFLSKIFSKNIEKEWYGCITLTFRAHSENADQIFTSLSTAIIVIERPAV